MNASCTILTHIFGWVGVKAGSLKDVGGAILPFVGEWVLSVVDGMVVALGSIHR